MHCVFIHPVSPDYTHCGKFLRPLSTLAFPGNKWSRLTHRSVQECAKDASRHLAAQLCTEMHRHRTQFCLTDNCWRNCQPVIEPDLHIVLHRSLSWATSNQFTPCDTIFSSIAFFRAPTYAFHLNIKCPTVCRHSFGGLCVSENSYACYSPKGDVLHFLYPRYYITLSLT